MQETHIMTHTKNAACCLAFGDVYLKNAVACLASARKFLLDQAQYVIFFANADPTPYKGLEWLHFESIESIIYARRSAEEIAKDRFIPREFKGIPFHHPLLRQKNLLYLDCDCFVFGERIVDIFDIIRRESVVIYGGYREEDVDLNYMGKSFKLHEKAQDAGIHVRNMSLNSGFVGRAADRKGWAFGQMIDELLQKRPLTMPQGYFNDEPYFMIAYQKSMENDSFDMNGINPDSGLSNLPLDMYACAGKSYVDMIDEGSGWPSLVKKKDGTMWTKPAVIHFVGFSSYPFYLQKVDETLAELGLTQLTAEP